MSTNTGPWLAPQWSNIPLELQAIPRWVVWRIARGTKVPFDPNHPEAHASVSRPDTWSTFDEARAVVQARQGEPDAFEGAGIVLDGDGLVGVDMDDCVEGEQLSPAALQILQELGPSYAELSPSGGGIRVFGLATPLVRGLRKRLDGISVELYSSGRYLTVTGHVLRDEPIGQLVGFSALAQRLQTAVAITQRVR